MDMSKDLTYSKDISEPLLFIPRKKTSTKMITVDDGRIFGVKLVGPAYKLHHRDGSYYPSDRPDVRFYNYVIWDPFVSEVLDYEMSELKKSAGIELRMLIGSEGYVKIYENRAVTLDEYLRVTTTNVSTVNVVSGDTASQRAFEDSGRDLLQTPKKHSSEVK